MNPVKAIAPILAITAVAAASVAPAQGYRYGHRNDTKNEWKSLAIGAGVLGVIGLLSDDSTLTSIGFGGAAYGAYRYEQDRRSQNRYGYYRYDSYRNGSYRGYDRYDPYRSGANRGYDRYGRSSNYSSYPRYDRYGHRIGR